MTPTSPLCNTPMQPLDRLNLLAGDLDLEPAEDAGCAQLDPKSPERAFIRQAVLPNGRRIPLLKSALTSACERNCYYCPFRAGRDFRRVSFKPDEMADTFSALHRAGIVQGIFLSSGVAGGSIRTQDALIATAEILRFKKGYQGYLHLKIMPGAERDQVVRAMQLADRVSVNLEAPNTNRLHLLAPRKVFMEELYQPLRWAAEIRQSLPAEQAWKQRWPSITTQFVVGAVGETDQELLKTTAYLNRHIQLRRAYYSAFRPIAGTPFENLPSESRRREHRLYQASFLLRDYGFGVDELPFEPLGNLPQAEDPKLAWARLFLANQPVEINRADYHELLRVPGIGPRGARAIIGMRQQGSLRELAALQHAGINAQRAAPFILLDGRRPLHQLSFW